MPTASSMSSPCIEGALPPHKKMKLEEENSNAQHEINDDKEKNTATQWYFVKLWATDALELELSGADPMAHFRDLLKAAGCCPESKIRPKLRLGDRICCYFFCVELTPNEAKQLSALDAVKFLDKEHHHYYRPQFAF